MNKCDKKGFCLAVAIILTVVFFGASVEALEIAVRDHAVILGANIFLGDVASFSPTNDPRIPKLRKIDLGAAPLPGRYVTLNHRYLIYRLNASLEGLSDIKVRLPERLRVRRKARKISTESLKKIYIDFVRNEAPWSDDQMEIRNVSVNGPVYLPLGEIKWSVRGTGTKKWVGETPAVITFYVNSKAAKKVPVSGRIFVKVQAVKSLRRISKGEIISRDDLLITAETVDFIKQGIVRDPDSIVGKRLKRTVFEGQYITDSMVEDSPLVKKGQRVLITAENETIKVSTLGRALQAGQKGDQVKVINLSSGKEIFATVCAPGRVFVAF